MRQLLRVVLIGAGAISRTYARVLGSLPGVCIVGVASRRQATATAFSERYAAGRATVFAELDALLADLAPDVVCVNSTPHLHAAHALRALAHGAHVIVEKPLCLTLAEADALLEAASRADRQLAYAENLCFEPLYRRARELVRAGELGHILRARQREKHAGPYSPWFWREEEAGGGALLDMGCHGIECLRWLCGKPPIVRVSARLETRLHGERTRLDDDAVVTLELADGARLVSESSWARPEGMQSTLEVEGTRGRLSVDPLGSRELRLTTERGERTEGPPRGTDEDSAYRAELSHFVDCFRSDRIPEETGRDGRAVLEILLAAYASAGRGSAVDLPFDPGDVARPVQLWRGIRSETGPA